MEVGDGMTLWVTLTNIALGVVTLLCVAAVAVAVACDLRSRFLASLIRRARREDPYFGTPGFLSYPKRLDEAHELPTER